MGRITMKNDGKLSVNENIEVVDVNFNSLK
jgi:hypothetical protein